MQANIKKGHPMNDEAAKTQECRCECCPQRRKFLKSSLQAFSAVALTVPAFGLFTACGQSPLSSGAPGTSGGTTVPNSANNVYTFNFSDYPQLQTAGGSIHVTIAAASGSKDLYVTRVDATTVDTVSTICTHAGCTINPYNSSSQNYLCACHGSVFSATGAVTNGPATIPLPSYASTLTSTGVQVTIP